jgi:predicted nuclease of restriction endonuclease-like (RecB) superfamily
MKVIKWIKWFFDFDRENESLNEQAQYQIEQLSKDPYVIEFFDYIKKK